MSRVLAIACACAAILRSAPARAQDGGALYAQRCASCHEGGQVARAPARDVIAALPPERIVAALETGTMRVQGESLTAEQRRAIAGYLSTARPAVAGATDASGCAALRRGRRAAADGERLARLGRDRRPTIGSSASPGSPRRRPRT